MSELNSGRSEHSENLQSYRPPPSDREDTLLPEETFTCKIKPSILFNLFIYAIFIYDHVLVVHN